MPGVITTLRLPEGTLERADALLPRLKHLGGARVSGELTRSEVLRLAVLRGLDALEQEGAQNRRRRKAVRAR